MKKLLRRTNESEVALLSNDLVVLPKFTFPIHYKVQEWLNENELNDEYEIQMVELLDWKQSYKVCCALQLKSGKAQFHWKLRGDDAAEKLQQEILDFKPER